MNLTVVSPTKTAYTGRIEKVTVPGADGQLTILPRHASLFAKLAEGELKVTKSEDGVFYMAIGGGFIEVNKNEVTVLVTRAVHEKELNEKEIIAAKKRAEEALKKELSPEEYRETRALLRSRILDLKVLRRRKTNQTPIR